MKKQQQTNKKHACFKIHVTCHVILVTYASQVICLILTNEKLSKVTVLIKLHAKQEVPYLRISDPCHHKHNVTYMP